MLFSAFGLVSADVGTIFSASDHITIHKTSIPEWRRLVPASSPQCFNRFNLKETGGIGLPGKSRSDSHSTFTWTRFSGKKFDYSFAATRTLVLTESVFLLEKFKAEPQTTRTYLLEYVRSLLLKSARRVIDFVANRDLFHGPMIIYFAVSSPRLWSCNASHHPLFLSLFQRSGSVLLRAGNI